MALVSLIEVEQQPSGHELELRFVRSQPTPFSACVCFVLYAHDGMFGQVTVTQGSSYISNAVTHPKYMFSRANSSKLPKSARNLAFF
jgi:hypothetical protein